MPKGPLPSNIDYEKHPVLRGLTSEFVSKLERDKAAHISRKIELHTASTDAATVSRSKAAMETLSS